MNPLTIAILIAIDVYLVYVVARAWKGIWHFGLPMALGVAAGVAAVVFGQIAVMREDAIFATLMEAAGTLCLLLVVWTLWRVLR
jgi:threonine/homoserine/homoserine lactone efflux protein